MKRLMPRTRCLLKYALSAMLVHAGSAQAIELFVPGAESDPRLRSAAYLADTGRSFSALTELLQMNPGGDFTRMPQDYQWLLAQTYLNFGMKHKSEEVYRHLATAASDPALMTRTRLRLARFEYERGYHDEARATLYGMREKLPDNLVDEWQDLLARVLMAGGRYPEALEILTDLQNGDRQTPYTRYNLGVAMINTGSLGKGRDVLDRVGRMRVTDIETMAFRDRVNMSLGWHFLKANFAGNAKQAFYRVRGTGPFSNRSLLGLGWAELSPESRLSGRDIPEDLTPFSTFATIGGVLRPGFLNRDVLDKQQNPYKLGRISPEEQEALRRAMVAWVELISRDPLDPAVQEAWLAIPYALDRLGAHREALRYYEQAVTQLEDTRRRLDLAKASIKRAVMVETLVRRDIDSEAGWGWKLKDLPDTPETYYLQTLLAEHRFQEALKNYRDVRLLGRSLESWKARLDQLEQKHQTRALAGESPDVLFKRAKQDWVEPWKKINIKLREETSLAPPGSSEAPFEAPPVPPSSLQLAEAPERFSGHAERIDDLRARIANLRELTAVAGAEQARLLQAMAEKELDGQRKAVDKYLIEARFALARLYDRELRAVPEAVPAEPVEGPGMLQRFLNVFGGGKSGAKP